MFPHFPYPSGMLNENRSSGARKRLVKSALHGAYIFLGNGVVLTITELLRLINKAQEFFSSPRRPFMAALGC